MNTGDMEAVTLVRSINPGDKLIMTHKLEHSRWLDRIGFNGTGSGELFIQLEVRSTPIFMAPIAGDLVDKLGLTINLGLVAGDLVEVCVHNRGKALHTFTLGLLLLPTSLGEVWPRSSLAKL